MSKPAKSSKQIESHLALSGDDVDHIIQPMKQHFELNSFVYKKIFHAGGELTLSNYPDWLDVYYSNSMYRYNVLELSPEHYVKGQLLWTQIPTHTPILDAAKAFSFDNGVTLIRPQHDGCEIFYLGGTRDTQQFGQLILNNLDITNQFTDYFKVQAHHLIQSAYKRRFSIYNKTDEMLYQPQDIPLYQSEQKRQQLLADMYRDGIPILIDGHKQHLTQKEYRIAQELLLGKSMREIGETLYISPRTVESHIEHLKLKFNTRKKSLLIQQLKQLIATP